MYVERWYFTYLLAELNESGAILYHGLETVRCIGLH